MRVVHLTKVKGISGCERHLLTLLPALRERGVDACFLSLDAGAAADDFHAALDELQIPWRRVECGADVSPRLAGAVTRALRDERPDLVHTHMVHADAYGSLAAHLLRAPFVSTRHNDDRYLLGPFRYVDRALMHGVGRIVAISDAVRVFHERSGLPARKLTTIHYGLDAAPSAASIPAPGELVPPDAPLVLSVGRLIAQKDHATLLEAFARVHASTPDARLAILGSGPLEAQTRSRAAALGLAERVLLPGRVEPRDWLARADVFAHTSRWEGFGIVLLEAMLAGLPIVATRVSAVPEIVLEGETGYLAAAGDAESIATRISQLLADGALRNSLGAAGTRRAHAEFSVARMADRTLAVYETVLR